MKNVGIEKLMNALKSAAAQNHFGADEFILQFQVFPQVRLLIGMRREVGMAGLGGHDDVTLSVPAENSFAESGARGDDHSSANRSRHAGINRVQIGGLQHADSVSGGFDIIDQAHTTKAEKTGHGGAIDDPGKVRRVDAIVDD